MGLSDSGSDQKNLFLRNAFPDAGSDRAGSDMGYGII